MSEDSADGAGSAGGDGDREADADGSRSRVRVRGIYATALTARLADEFAVVQASLPIRERFDREFPRAPADVRVETTVDRQGVSASGDPDAVTALAESLATTGRDALDWADDAPAGAVFDAVVDRTVGGGAVLDLGDGGEGYLPFDAVDAHVTEGDALRVQVRDPAAPWADDRPVCATDLEVGGGVATLVEGVSAAVAGAPRGHEDELARLTGTLPTTVPDGWGVRWEYGADEVSMDALDDALAAAAERVDAVESALAEAPSPDEGAPGRLVAPAATRWCWFGRESRFALDEARREAATTMAGHHRVKAAGGGASEAVDFAERLCGAVESFPTAAVLEQFGPAEGDAVAIAHGKPDGRLLTLGRADVTDRDPAEGVLELRRTISSRGRYDGLDAEREPGDVAVTKVREGRWWYPTVYRDEGNRHKGTYVNVCTPVEVFPDAVRYVDLHVDVVKEADGAVRVVDREELDAAVAAGDVPPPLAEQARSVAERVASGIQ